MSEELVAQIIKTTLEGMRLLDSAKTHNISD